MDVTLFYRSEGVDHFEEGGQRRLTGYISRFVRAFRQKRFVLFNAGPSGTVLGICDKDNEFIVVCYINHAIEAMTSTYLYGSFVECTVLCNLIISILRRPFSCTEYRYLSLRARVSE